MELEMRHGPEEMDGLEFGQLMVKRRNLNNYFEVFFWGVNEMVGSEWF